MHHRSTRKFARSETSTPSTASLQLKAFRSSSKGKLAGGLSSRPPCALRAQAFLPERLELRVPSPAKSGVEFLLPPRHGGGEAIPRRREPWKCASYVAWPRRFS